MFDAQMNFEIYQHYVRTALLADNNMILKEINENDIKLIHSDVYLNLLTLYL